MVKSETIGSVSQHLSKFLGLDAPRPIIMDKRGNVKGAQTLKANIAMRPEWVVMGSLGALALIEVFWLTLLVYDKLEDFVDLFYFSEGDIAKAKNNVGRAMLWSVPAVGAMYELSKWEHREREKKRSEGRE